MAQKFVTNLNLNQNQLINGTFEVLASDPSTDNFEGRLIYNARCFMASPALVISPKR